MPGDNSDRYIPPEFWLMHSKVPEFTPRELEMIRLICEERTNKEMADMLFLSVRTVEGYRDKILEKIQAKNAVGIVVFAIKNNIYKIS